MPSKSKTKGSGAERELAKFLGEVYDDNFMRVPTSGAITGGQNHVRKEYMSEGQIRAMKADIIPPDFMPKFVIECKFYKDLPFHLFTSEGNSVKLVDKWLEELYFDCDEDDVGFLCFKLNRKGWFVVFHKDLLNHDLQLDNHIIYNDYIVTDMKSFFINNKDIVMEITK